MKYTRFYLAIFLFLTLCCTSLLQAQVPQAFHYQMVVRDGGDQLVRSRSIGLRLTIQRANAGSPVILYQETQTLATDLNGLLQVEVGRGTRNPSYGLFADIPWGDYTDIELKAEADPAGGTAYSLSATQPLQAVPYAFLSAESQGLGNVASLGNHAGGLQLKSVKDPTEAQDVVTKHYFDSVIAELVRLNNAYTRDTAACVTPESLPFAWRGHSLSGSGIYRHTLAHAAAGGLDSIIILTLTVASGTHNVETVVACDSYEWHAVSRTATGNYTYAYTNAGGCPSVDTLKLTINATTSYTDSRTACDSLRWHGVKYTTPQTDGTVTHTTTGTNGCDSTVTLHLTAVYTTAHTAYNVATRGAYTWASAGSDGHGDGSIYAVSGSYTGPEYADANGCPAHDTLHLTVTPVNIDNVLNGRFTINAEGDKVLFSRGNLQYLKSGTDGYANQTFRFALHQYDFVGGTSTSEPTGTFGNVYLSNSTQCGNQNISSTYQGWIDLFGWGTSGWNSGAGIYQPWFSSTTSADYTPGGVASNNLTDDYANADWGVYNPIVNGGNTAGQFRVLTSDEWSYLYNTRTDAASKRSQGRIDMGGGDYVFGVILLPDEWTLPTGCSFDANFATNGYATNTYSLAQWALMEANGAVFLPQAGQRNGTDFQMVNVYRSRYWSSTNNGAGNAFVFQFHSGSINPAQSIGRAMGNSVRLVFDDADCTAGSSSDSHTECDSYTWPVNGVTYTASGTYTARLINSHGCDSTITLTLTINPAKAFTDSRTACDSLRWHGVKYTTPQTDGTVTYATTAANGCDSTVTLHLTAVYTTAHQSYDVEETLPFTWAASGTYGHVNGTAYAAEGTYVGPEYADANSCPAHDTLHLTISSNNGCTLGGTFTVNASGDRVQFTCGNLQYRASTNEWRLAPEQWHFVGSGSYYAFDNDDTEYKCNSAKSDNNNISSSYCGWIDLFGFGTSGWNSGYTAYQPYSTSSTAGDYINRSLTGEYANADWGVYNVISGAPAGTYRTMTSDEWQYILSGRENAAQKYGMGTLFGIWGVFFIPDSWTQPAGITFTAGTASNWSTNTYTTDEQWEALQNSGVVFLPFTGYRYTPASWNDPGSIHYVKYHSSTIGATTTTHNTFYAFVNSGTPTIGVGNADGWYNGNQYGFAVRLVKDFEPCEVVAPVQNETACDSYTWPSTGVTYTGSTTVSGVRGIHQSPEGCDSIVSLNLTIIPSNCQAYYATAVGSYTWTADGDMGRGSGSTYAASGTYTGPESVVDGCASADTLHLGIKPIQGSMPGKFSVAAGKQVSFSQGNLQYLAKAADGYSDNSWRFAENQWNWVGDGSTYGNVYMADGTTRCDNTSISENDHVWIDMFGYACSGWDNGKTCYQPYHTTNTATYYLGQTLTGTYARGDWAFYNRIYNGGYNDSLWRTLSSAEMTFLLGTTSPRTANHRSFGTVNGVAGLIILPDSWTLPNGCSYTGNVTANFTTNTYTLDQWRRMETAGAIFLPQSYRRVQNTAVNTGDGTYYWTSTSASTNYSYLLKFLANTLSTASSISKFYGGAVRPVYDLPNSCEIKYTTVEHEGCDKFELDGETYYSDVEVVKRLVADDGCDSLVTHHIAIKQSGSKNYYVQNLDSYTWPTSGDKGHGTGATYTESNPLIVGPRYDGDNACDAYDTLHLTITPIEGAIAHPFSVAADKQVYFSNGNLQWQGSTNTWRFAEHQYTAIGNASGNTTTAASRASNANWIDLFGYGTSGWSGSGATYYRPYDNNSTSTSYLAQNLSGDFANADWGVYNAILGGGNVPELWRTLSQSELTYLLNTRTNANQKKATASVAGVPGLVLLPDDWSLPVGCTFTAANYSTSSPVNIYTAAQWSDMEANGAVFLPLGGFRTNTSVTTGYLSYWTSTHYNASASNSYRLYLSNGSAPTVSYSYKHYGYNVRLVVNAPTTCATRMTSAMGSETITNCGPFAYHGTTYYADTATTVCFTNASGCDTLVRLTLTIKSTGDKYKVNPSEDTYTWAADGDKGHGTGLTYGEEDAGIILGPTYTADGCTCRDTLKLSFIPEGRLSGLFSVSATKQVYFSQGNLQYTTTGEHAVATGGTQSGTFRFAEHQYDFVGNATYGTVYESGTKSNNNSISSSYTGWIDLFGWGSSGWSGSGMTNNVYYPFSSAQASGTYEYYNINGSPTQSFSQGSGYENADWGVFNAISNGGDDTEIGWRTLSYDEWTYIRSSRTNASNLIGLGCIDLASSPNASQSRVYGLILLPDDWTAVPDGCPAWKYFSATTAANNKFTSNIYTEAQWEKMEEAGAVFMPAAGFRGTGTSNGTTATVTLPTTASYHAYTRYWTSTAYTATGTSAAAYQIYFHSSASTTNTASEHTITYSTSAKNKPTGCSVRLVLEKE